ncbi:oxysterol-binding protein-related protein 6-like [Lingula anatina]|uniref:Oxysterol-binding protein n=1 Tax=Lingula anatina TaxID=7574 RepID=A0A2R2MM79_LINAN|nr:oxysterol-binding protein-related protein 6-like [Lingula anatina]|eukprot:XP_023931326.1 oxysterol-binding protein-related protein 6-like [Lingula anatina]
MSSSSDAVTPKRPIERSPLPDGRTTTKKSVKERRQHLQRADASDSDSDDSLSVSSSTMLDLEGRQPRTAKVKKSKGEWIIIEGLRDGQKFDGRSKPVKFDGYCLKTRKWPLKGWHKRYFSLENGILSYAKYPRDVSKFSIILVGETLKTLVRTLNTERDRLKCALEQDAGVANVQGSAAYIQTLRQALSEAHQQNKELRSRLARIHGESDLSVLPSPQSTLDSDQGNKLLSQSLSLESTSISEFFDAAEYIAPSASSSEGSDEESDSSEVEDGEEFDFTPPSSDIDLAKATGHREKLPAPKTDAGDLNLWNLLCKNIGKDLSKISMPVTLNEPLNILQWLCEELEYSELVDKAAQTDDPIDRMVYVAAFAVSAYASSSCRAGQKPFNPLLGETYECVREDKGWKFIAEQVSHHPPISACHCDSPNFIFWQESRIKNKFWGRSMEIHPVGTVHLVLPKYGDHYQWNKVTSCIHNILSGQRWVEQYGEMVITAGAITCKLTFAKASYWSNKKNEVYGNITDKDGKVVQYLFGKWTEGLYCGKAPSVKCIWRPGALPDDYELYYGFTKFAIELNELNPSLKAVLPPTDTRFRTDQRLLEEGHIAEAETEKLRVEQLQRDRRKQREAEGIKAEPMWFRRERGEDGSEHFVFSGKYWDARKNQEFVKMTFPKLW